MSCDLNDHLCIGEYESVLSEISYLSIKYNNNNNIYFKVRYPHNFNILYIKTYTNNIREIHV